MSAIVDFPELEVTQVTRPFVEARKLRMPRGLAIFGLVLIAFLAVNHLLADRFAATLLGSRNSAMLQRVTEINWATGGTAVIRELYSPLGVILAIIIPGGLGGFALVGVVVAATFLSYIYRVVSTNKWDSMAVLLMFSLAATPLFVGLAIGDLFGLLALVTFGVGLVNLHRYISQRHTDAGFRAGVWLAICSLIDPAGIALVLVALVITAFFTRSFTVDTESFDPVSTDRGEVASRFAVLFFPTLSIFASIVLLETVYLFEPFASSAAIIDFEVANWAAFAHLFTTAQGWILLTTAFIGSCAAYFSGRIALTALPQAILVILLLAQVAGLLPASVIIYALFLTTLMLVVVWDRLPIERHLRGVVFILGSLLILGWVVPLMQSDIPLSQILGVI